MYNASQASLIKLILFPTQIPRASMDPNDNLERVTSEVSLTTRPSSWATTHVQSTSKGLAGVQAYLAGGIFDDDKVPSTLQVSLVIKKKDIHSAAYLRQSPFIKSEGSDLSKNYQNPKVTNIPITEDHELAQWDLIVCGVMGPMSVRAKDVHENPAIKKVAPTTFGYPLGALALSTAVVKFLNLECALTLFKTGVNVQEDRGVKPGACAFNNNLRGGIVCQYAQSTSIINAKTQPSLGVTDGWGKILVSDNKMDIQGYGNNDN
ncbi:hypothetical protein EI94DRAFT_1699744 [Lactarius quietus]|nr:hypothetical protein EI94DRAFT_1699744 [Lactarius quietus]